MRDQLPSTGRIVHVVIGDAAGKPAVRPGVVVDDKKARKGLIGVKVFLKGDGADRHIKADYFADLPFSAKDATVGTWHWPEHVEGSMDEPAASQEKPETVEGTKPAKKKGKKPKEETPNLPGTEDEDKTAASAEKEE